MKYTPGQDQTYYQLYLGIFIGSHIPVLGLGSVFGNFDPNDVALEQFGVVGQLRVDDGRRENPAPARFQVVGFAQRLSNLVLLHQLTVRVHAPGVQNYRRDSSVRALLDCCNSGSRTMLGSVSGRVVVEAVSLGGLGFLGHDDVNARAADVFDQHGFSSAVVDPDGL